MSPTPLQPEVLLADLAWMRRLAASLVSDPGTADDLVQETWLAALRRRWPGGRPTRAWLSRVLRSQAVDRFRSDARRREREVRTARSETVTEDHDPVQRLEAQHLLVATVLELEEPTRTILLLRYQEDLQPSEIARRLELPAGTVRSRLSRGLQLLRGRLEQRMGSDYRAALAPLLTVGIGKVATGVTSTSLHHGVLMKKLLIASALAVSAVALFESGPWRDAPPVGDPNAAAVGAADRTTRQPAAVPDTGPPARARLTLAPRFGAADGWWLEGTVRGRRGFGTVAPRITVRDGDGDIPTALRGEVDPAGRGEVDVGALFRHPTRLTQGLRVEVEHPDYLTARLRLAVGREVRQAGFGGRSRIPFTLDLEPVTGRVSGRVAVPAGAAPADARVALFDAEELAAGGGEPVDNAAVAADGSFRLRARSGRRHLLVAWSCAGHRRLRPTTVPCTPSPDAAPLQVPLVAGAAIRGTARLPEVPAGVQFGLRSRGLLAPAQTVGTAPVGPAVADPAIAAAGVARGPATPTHSRATAAAPFVDLDDLVFTGGRFEYGRVDVPVDAQGRFELGGLFPARGYFIEDLQPVVDGLPVPVQTMGSLDPVHGFDQEVLTAPLDDAAIDYQGRLLFTRFTLDGVAVDPCDATMEFEDAQFLIDPDARGLFAIETGASPKPFATVFEAPGCTPLQARLRTGSWCEVALQRHPDVGDVTLHLAGAALPRVEQLHVSWQRIVTEEDREPIDTLFPPVFRRIGDRLEVHGLPAGRYRVRVLPGPGPSFADFGAFAQTRLLNVELAPGPRNFVPVTLEPAGYLELADPQKFFTAADRQTGQSYALFELRDASGERIPAGTVPAAGPAVACITDGSMGRIDLRRASRFYPLLAPGSYTLEIYTAEQPDRRRRVPVVIRGGAVTRLDPPAPGKDR